MIAAAVRVWSALGPQGRRPWIVAIEALVWLGAALLLLAQIACVPTVALDFTPATVHLSDATFTPAFVASGASLPARVRYWVAPTAAVTVTWPEIRIGPSCNLCLSQENCPTGSISLAADVWVSVNHRPTDADSLVEDARFDVLSGCTNASGTPPSFTPTAWGDYLAHVSTPGATPVPSEPGTWVRINVLSSEFTLPPRLMRPGAASDNEWVWSAISDLQRVKEAFDPRLRVGRVRVLVGTCTAPPKDGQEDECGADLLMDPAFTMRRLIAPYYIHVHGGPGGLVSLQDCRGVASAPDGDGDINLGPDPSSPSASLCRPQHRRVLVTPNYSSEERQAGAPLTWTVEFSADDGFPPPSRGEQVWIEFTLVPGP